jgi:hypothetical protein
MPSCATTTGCRSRHRQNVLNLGMFVMAETFSLMSAAASGLAHPILDSRCRVSVRIVFAAKGGSCLSPVYDWLVADSAHLGSRHSSATASASRNNSCARVTRFCACVSASEVRHNSETL